MPEQDQTLRVHNHQEVPYGFTTELALLEAGRCLQCKNPQCVLGCPVNVDPAFLALVADRHKRGREKDQGAQCLPSHLRQGLPTGKPVRSQMHYGHKDEPVAIGRLERFVADFERKMDLIKVPIVTKNRTKNCRHRQCPGDSPLLPTCASLAIPLPFLKPCTTGGVLTYGIPEFRLPKAIVQFEIDYLKQMGVRFELNHVIGNIYTVDELLEHFDAVFIGVGAGLPVFMGIEGESLGNIFSANEYLTRMNLMKAYRFPEYDTPMPKGIKWSW